MSTALTSGPQSQEGAILALGLMLLLIVSMLATSGMANATLEAVKAGSSEAMDNAFYAAENGITFALTRGDFSQTGGSNMPILNMPDGTSVATRIRYLGLLHPSVDEPGTALVEYHFLIETTVHAIRYAITGHVLQVMVPAPAPVDPALCLSIGCDIPVICPPAPNECEMQLRVQPLRIAWHISEDLS